MHPPPCITHLANMDASGVLEGAAELEQIMAAHPNVERSLCCHLHRTIFRRFGGTVASTCPGPAHQVALDLRPDGPSAYVMEPPGFHLHDWREGALVTPHAYIAAYAGPYTFHEGGAMCVA